MDAVDWSIEGIEFGSCNCAYGCPCQFEALPTYGDCRGFEVIRIDRGRFGDVTLDGLNVALVYAWPGPIFEGNGELQVIIDVRADPRQREALLRCSWVRRRTKGRPTRGCTGRCPARSTSRCSRPSIFRPIWTRAVRSEHSGGYCSPLGGRSRGRAARSTGFASRSPTGSSSSGRRWRVPPLRPGA